MLKAKGRRTAGKPSWRSFMDEFSAIQDVSLMEGVVAGCAVVAYADGWVTEEEKKRMAGLIHGFTPMRAFGITEVMHAFEETTRRFEADHDEGELHALSVVGALRGRERYPELLVQTCCAIAAADGGFDAEERAAASRVCQALGLDPAEFDLADAR